MDEPISFGYWVRRCRKALDLTQAELARRVGCATVTIQKIEADERRPSAQIAALLANRLQIPADERAVFLATARGGPLPEHRFDSATTTRPGGARAPHRLPTPLTSFVGRTEEIASLRAMLAETRLLSLAGAGGSGKTRLALELAGTVQNRFPGGVWLIELTPLTDPALLIPTIAAVLEIREDPGQPLLNTLIASLGDAHALLLLDNCEHLIDTCAQIAATLLQACPRLRILITSREPLGVPGEQIFRVPTLATPDLHHLPSLAQLVRYPAVQLFIDRARAVLPAFAATDANAASIAQICARLDGIPLAIELAAARVRLLPPAQIAARLDDRFRLLNGGSRTAVSRQQTLRALIDWSYDLLTGAERLLLQRLAVFAGGWALAAAEAVCTDALQINADDQEGISATSAFTQEPNAILDLLGHLVDKSLVEVEPGEQQARYRMLETIRVYAREKLAASGSEQALQRQHAIYFRDLARSYRSRQEWMHGNTREIDNLWAALSWSQSASGDLALSLELAQILGQLEWNRGDYTGVRYLQAHVLEHARELRDTPRYAEITLVYGTTLGQMGDLAACRILYEQAYAMYQKLADQQNELRVLERLGWVAREQGDTTAARAWLEQGISRARQSSNPRLLIGLLTGLAEVAVIEEDADTAAVLLDQVVALREASKEQRQYGWTWNHLGHVALLRGDYHGATELHARSLAALIAEHSDTYDLAWVYQDLGQTALAEGDLAAARRWLRDALRLCHENGDHIILAWCLAGLGSVAALEGAAEQAARLWSAAKRLRATVGCRPAPAARAAEVRAVALASAQLGVEGFAMAWAAGAALSLEQAIAVVMTEADAL